MRRALWIFSAEPELKQRCRRREEKKGQANARGKQAENAPRRILHSQRFPFFGGGDRQPEEHRQEQGHVKNRLRARAEAQDAEMRVSVAGQKQQLEEKHACSPYGR